MSRITGSIGEFQGSFQPVIPSSSNVAAAPKAGATDSRTFFGNDAEVSFAGTATIDPVDFAFILRCTPLSLDGAGQTLQLCNVSLNLASGAVTAPGTLIATVDVSGVLQMDSDPGLVWCVGIGNTSAQEQMMVAVTRPTTTTIQFEWQFNAPAVAQTVQYNSSPFIVVTNN